MPSPSQPRYDQGLRYDTGIRYASVGGSGEPINPAPKPKHMAQIKYPLSRKSGADLIAQGKLTSGKLNPTGAGPPPPPIPAMVAQATVLLAATTLADVEDAKVEALKVALAQQILVRNAAVDALRKEHAATISGLEAAAKGDPVILAHGGYPVSTGETTPSAVPGPVRNLTLTANEADGTLDGTHEPAEDAVSYQVQITTVDPITGPYHEVLTPTSSTWKLTGLTSGSRVWIRVRGIGPKGQGPWSDPATKIVP